MHGTMDRRALGAEVLHDVDLAAGGPADGADVIAQHPESRPDATSSGKLNACFEASITLAEEAFGLEPLADQQISLRMSNGQYLSVEQGGERRVVAGPLWPGESETFHFERLERGGLALQTARGLYLRRVPGGRLLADSTKPGGAETFVLQRRTYDRATA